LEQIKPSLRAAHFSLTFFLANGLHTAADAVTVFFIERCLELDFVRMSASGFHYRRTCNPPVPMVVAHDVGSKANKRVIVSLSVSFRGTGRSQIPMGMTFIKTRGALVSMDMTLCMPVRKAESFFAGHIRLPPLKLCFILFILLTWHHRCARSATQCLEAIPVVPA
jgi:hypothetical protein